MSLKFNDTTNLNGLAQIFEKEIGANPGDITGSTAKMKAFTADSNLALDDYFAIALSASGKWQLDDSNQIDYPVIYNGLVSGQRDYAFTTDGTGNLILDIYRVFVLVSATSTIYQEIFPVDQQSETDTESFTNGQNVIGVPIRYDKTANGFFLDPVPSYTVANGIKVMINREASYFSPTDTTKKPGVPGLHHKYFALKPALDHARRNNLANVARLEAEVLKYEGDEEKGIIGSIARYFGKRSKDERNIMRPKITPFI